MPYSKGPRGTAERLHSEIVRQRGACERCGSTYKLECAHIVRRWRATTCTDIGNAWCLCGPCHDLVDEWADEFMALVIRTIGRTGYERLRRKAEEGLFRKVDWRDEVKRLRAIKNGSEAA